MSHGIVVVEPAGNGRLVDSRHEGWDLDNLAEEDAPDWHPIDGELPHSGAIMVAACVHDANSGAWIPRKDSNYGSRVDCYGPGEQILAASTADKHQLAGDLDLPSNAPSGDVDAYYGWFAQTSAASAIIAGVLLATQGLIRKMWDPESPDEWVWPLSPQQLRQILRDEGVGTAVASHSGVQSNSPTPTRVIPSLELIAQHLVRVPLMHLRGDENELVGSTEKRSFGVDSQSPDIVVLDHALPLGDASLFNSDSYPNDTLRRGQAAYLYVRASNFGDGPAPKARTVAYWSYRGAPDEEVTWHPLGQSASIDVPDFGTLFVLPPVEWSVPDSPPTGADQLDILVVVGDDRWDPRPELPMINDVSERTLSRLELLNFIQLNRNAAWRTVDCSWT